MDITRMERDDYPRSWYEMMTKIWRDRILSMCIYDTGALYRSVGALKFAQTDADFVAIFKFLLYGLFIDIGRGGANPRRARRWYSTSWRISREVLKNHFYNRYGEAFKGITQTLK